MQSRLPLFAALIFLSCVPHRALAAPAPLDFTVNTSEVVNVDTTGGTPRIAVDVGGVTRYATYHSGTGTSALVFRYDPVAGDVDLDGVAVSSPIDLNGGTIKDGSGNDATLTFTPPNTTNVKVNYPSLSMDFVYDADGRYTLNGTAYNDLTSFLSAAGGTFSRSSIGTYFDSSGTLQTATSNTPRFDHDPVTHVAKGILIEESRTNLVLYSNAFSTSSWIKGTGTTVIQNATAPDGSGTTAWTAVISNSGAGLYQQITGYLGQTATISIWLRSTSGTQSVYLHRGNTSTPALLSVGTTWQRYSATLTNSTGADYFELRTDENGSGSGGLPTATLEIYGAQFEIGSFPTSYVPTTSAAVTRNADDFYLPTGSWTSSTQGTLFGSFSDWQSTGGIFALNDNQVTSPNRADCRGGQNQCIISAANANTNLPIVFTYGSSNRVALSYSSTVGAAVLNGGTVITGTPRVPVNPTRLWIGNIDHGSYWLNGHIAKFKYYPAAFPNTQLQLLTQ